MTSPATTDLHLDILDRAERARIDDPDRTPSARILASMRKARVPFFRFAMNQSILHKGLLRRESAERREGAYFESLAERSIDAQRDIEAADSESLDEYLAHYMAAPSIGGA